MQDLTRVKRTLCQVNISFFEVGSQQWGRCGGVWQFVWVLQWIPRNDVIDLVPVSLLLAFDIFCTLVLCSCCWILQSNFLFSICKKYVMLKIDSEWYHVSKRRARTHTHTRTHTETYTHIYTYTHTHTYINWI